MSINSNHMNHKELYIVIPAKFIDMNSRWLKQHLQTIMKKYDESICNVPTVVLTSDDVINQYNEHIDDYDTIEEFCKKMYGSIIDDKGNAIKMLNPFGLYDSYEFREWHREGEYDGVTEINENIDIFECSISMEDFKEIYKSIPTYFKDTVIIADDHIDGCHKNITIEQFNDLIASFDPLCQIVKCAYWD
jgi:hypothetical protein